MAKVCSVCDRAVVDRRRSFLILMVRPNIDANAETRSIFACRPSAVLEIVARSSA